MTVFLLKLFTILFGCYVLTILIAAALVDTSRLYTNYSPFYRFLLRSSTAVALFFCRVHIEVTGVEKLPQKPFLLLCNHRSAFDPLITMVILSQVRLAFISKPENFRIPVFGRLIRRCCFLPIDRENPRRAMDSIISAAELLNKGEQSVAMYPEGTRNTSDELLPFHAGVMKIAQKAHVGIVVATVEGTDRICKNVPFRRSRVRLSILETFPPEALQARRSTELGNEVRNIMEAQLKH